MNTGFARCDAIAILRIALGVAGKGQARAFVLDVRKDINVIRLHLHHRLFEQELETLYERYGHAGLPHLGHLVGVLRLEREVPDHGEVRRRDA